MRSPAFTRRSYAVLIRLSPGYPPLLGTFRCITHPFATRHQGCPRAAVRLACVRHAASVQSEPGSNSSVRYCVLDYSRWNREALANFSFHCVSTNDLSSAKSIAVRLFDLVAPFIKRPHLSAVSFLKNKTPVARTFYRVAERESQRGAIMKVGRNAVKQHAGEQRWSALRMLAQR